MCLGPRLINPHKYTRKNKCFYKCMCVCAFSFLLQPGIRRAFCTTSSYSAFWCSGSRALPAWTSRSSPAPFLVESVWGFLWIERGMTCPPATGDVLHQSSHELSIIFFVSVQLRQTGGCGFLCLFLDDGFLLVKALSLQHVFCLFQGCWDIPRLRYLFLQLGLGSLRTFQCLFLLFSGIFLHLSQFIL